jgi:hypothetical protein
MAFIAVANLALFAQDFIAKILRFFQDFAWKKRPQCGSIIEMAAIVPPLNANYDGFVHECLRF